MENLKTPWVDWIVTHTIGQGGFGTVYEIEQVDQFGIANKAAMKVIHFPQNNNENRALIAEGYDKDSITAFNRERLDKVINEYAVMMQMKGHRNIVRCDDCASVPHVDGMGWDVYIRMELLTSLHTKLEDGVLSETEIIKLGKDLCQALMLCEEKNIVHRDIKPENIFVNEYGDYKLGDFGISRTMERTTNATRTGSPRFMAPEVYKDQKYGSSIDIYSLGLVMYWLLNNYRMPFLPVDRPPTLKENEEALQKRMAGEEELPAPLHGSEELKQVILKACAYPATDRYATAEEFHDALENVKGKESDNNIDTYLKSILVTDETEAVVRKKEFGEFHTSTDENNSYQDYDSTMSMFKSGSEIEQQTGEITAWAESMHKKSDNKSIIPQRNKRTLIYILAPIGFLIVIISVCLFGRGSNKIADVQETNSIVSVEPIKEDKDPTVSEEDTTYNNGMIFPSSSEERLNNTDIEGLSKDELRHALNEIYARHGYIFANELFVNEFEQYPWYEPTINADDWNGDTELNRIEKYNTEFLKNAIKG